MPRTMTDEHERELRAWCSVYAGDAAYVFAELDAERAAHAETERQLTDEAESLARALDELMDLRARLTACERERDEARAIAYDKGADQSVPLVDAKALRERVRVLSELVRDYEEIRMWTAVAFGEPTQEAFLRVFDSWRSATEREREHVRLLRELVRDYRRLIFSDYEGQAGLPAPWGERVDAIDAALAATAEDDASEGGER